MQKKIIISTITLLIIFVLAFFIYNIFFVKSKSIQTASVKQGSLKISFLIDGKTSIERRDLKFTVNGKVSHIAVKEGQKITAGQYLMALDTQDVQKNLEKDLKDYSISRNNFDQTKLVTYPSGAINDTVKRLLDNNQYALDKSVLDVEIRDIALRESYLYSPIEGIVSAINLKVGETTNTQSSTAVITITKPESLIFEAFAEDTDVLKINDTQKTLVKIDAIPNINFPSKVEFISNIATVDQNGLSTYKIRATITDQKNLTLFDGMTGQIQFITKEKNNILIIPNNAVFRKNNQSFVKKLENKILDTQVQTGFTDGKEVEVISGLKINDKVVIQ